jgi:hypothetical protein
MPGFLEFQPQAPHAPFDPDATGRFFEGMDLCDFDTLRHRIVPSRIMHSYVAADFAGRYWWWDASDDGQRWSLVPSDLDCLRIVQDFEQWKQVAALAVKTLQELFGDTSAEDRKSALKELYVLQEALFAIWAVPITHLGRGWLYLTVTQTSRWALPGLEIPRFCAVIFGSLLTGTWDAPLSEEHLVVLRRDPLLRHFPEMGAPIFPKPESAPVTLRGNLAVIQGGRR